MTTTTTKPTVRLTRRVREIRISPTIAVMNRAQELIGKGVDVVDFGPGEPDFPTPPSVAAAGKRAIDKGLTKCWHRLTRPRSAKLGSRPNETARGVSRSDACRSLDLLAVCSGELRPLALVVALPAAPSGELRPSAPVADKLSHPPQAIPSLA